jgi:hypothetical protein
MRHSLPARCPRRPTSQCDCVGKIARRGPCAINRRARQFCPPYDGHLASRKSRKNVFFGGGDAVEEAGAALAVRARSSAGGGVKPLVSSPSEGRDADDCGAVSPALGGGSSPPLRPHAARPSAAIMAAAKASRLDRSTDFFTCTPPPQMPRKLRPSQARQLSTRVCKSPAPYQIGGPTRALPALTHKSL